MVVVVRGGREGEKRMMGWRVEGGGWRMRCMIGKYKVGWWGSGWVGKAKMQVMLLVHWPLFLFLSRHTRDHARFDFKGDGNVEYQNAISM